MLPHFNPSIAGLGHPMFLISSHFPDHDQLFAYLGTG